MPRILVTGACGTIGSEVVRQLLEREDGSEIISLDNNESDLFFLEHRLGAPERTSFNLCDIRDEDRLTEMMRGVDLVFHTAAYKHVWLCERSPFEAVQTNIMGVQNVIRAAKKNNVARTIFCSSDKAVNPTNVMGASKLMGEKLMTAANQGRAGEGPIFASTRFGNVLGSRGSVVPVFREQIRQGGPVTLTHPGMTRFIMSIGQAVELIIDSSRLALGGEIFITKMPVIRIEDLARGMIAALAPGFGHDPARIEIRSIGAKPGEKMFEELMNLEETRRALELEKYFVVLPAFQELSQDIAGAYPGLVSAEVDNPYISDAEEALTREELIAALGAYGLLGEEERRTPEPAHRYWPDSSR